MKMKKVMPVLLVAVMSVGLLAGCGKESAQDVYAKMQDKNVALAQVFDEMLEDEVLTRDEVERALDMIPSGTATVGMNFTGTAALEQNGSTMNLDGGLHGDVELDIDKEDREFHVSVNLSGNYDVMGITGTPNACMDFYLINENGEYYLYSKESAENSPAVKTYVGSLDAFIGESLDMAGFYEELGGMKLADAMKEGSEPDAVVKAMTLAKDKVTQNGQSCYKLSVNITGDIILNTLKNDEAYLAELEELGMTMEEFLATKIVGDFKIYDLMQSMNFRCNYYVNDETYTLVSWDVDLKDALKTTVEKAIEAYAKEQNAGKYNLNVDFSSAVMYYSYIAEDVDVTFDGKYIEE